MAFLIQGYIRQEILRWTSVQPNGPEGHPLRLPFWDNLGDPVEPGVAQDRNGFTIDDGGTIAGILFSLNVHLEGSPAFSLLEKLCAAHRLEIDSGQGCVKTSVTQEDLYDGITEVARVILTMDSAAPHLST